MRIGSQKRMTERFGLCGIARKNPFFMQLYADVTGQTIEVTSASETCALGAAIFAAVAAGPDAGGYRTENLGEAGRVALTLSEVHWYQRSIDHVPRGHTAGLAVKGDGLELLAELLRGLPRHDCLSLVVAKPQDAEPVAADVTSDS